MTTTIDPTETALPLPCLAVFTRTGQDKSAVETLIGALIADLRPRNLMERVWIRDLAVLTIRSEELRLVQVAVHKLLVERTQTSAGALPGAKPVAGAQDQPAGCASTLERVLAMTYAEHLAALEAIATMEADVRRDRDRIIAVFDQRRNIDMPSVIKVVREVMEGKHDSRDDGDA